MRRSNEPSSTRRKKNIQFLYGKTRGWGEFFYASPSAALVSDDIWVFVSLHVVSGSLCLCEEARVKLMGKSELRNVEQTHNAGHGSAQATNKELSLWNLRFCRCRACIACFSEGVFFFFDELFSGLAPPVRVFGTMHGKMFLFAPKSGGKERFWN